VNLCAACGEWRRLQSVKKFVVSRTEIPTASIDTTPCRPKIWEDARTRLPNFSRVLRRRVGLLEGPSRGIMPVPGHDSFLAAELLCNH
jgi:hypothetical protein